MIVALVETHHCLALSVSSDGELALAAVAFPLLGAFHEFFHPELWHFPPLLDESVDFCIPEVLSVVVFKYSFDIFLFGLDLCWIVQAMQWFHNIPDISVSHFL